jgi:hypothetical protein
MKRLSVLLTVLLVFGLTSCIDEFPEVGEVTFTLNDQSREFELGDEIPDFNDYFTLDVPGGYESIEFVSDLEGDVFDQEGEFLVRVLINTHEFGMVEEEFTILVSGSSAEVYLGEKAHSALVNVENALYLTMFTELLGEFDNGDYPTLYMTSLYKYSYNMDTQEVILYEKASVDLGDYSQEIETYIVPRANDFLYIIGMEGQYSEMSLNAEEFLQMYPIMDDMMMSDLISPDQEYDVTVSGDGVFLDIPLSDSNFSLSAYSELTSVLMGLGLIPFDVTDEDLDTIDNYYSLIDCRVQLNLSQTVLLSIEFDLYDFALALASDESVETTLEMDDMASLVFTYRGFSMDYFTTTLPETSGYLPIVDELDNDKIVHSVLQDNEDLLIDSEIDVENALVYFTRENDHHLYVYDYLNGDVRAVYFEMYPDHITFDSDNIYVTLTPGHEYYWPEDEQYGGLGVIAKTTYNTTVHNLSFDPYDIVVDQDGILYVSTGSHQHGYLAALNPISGQVIDTFWGVYYGSQLELSPNTDRLYVFETNTSDDSVMIIEIDGGIFMGMYDGTDDLDDHHISMDPNGDYIFSGNGMILETSTNISDDTDIYALVDYEFNIGAYDPDTGYYYLVADQLILVLDNDLELLGALSYALNASSAVVADGKLIVVTNRTVELFDLSSFDNNLQFYITYPIGQGQNLETYIEDVLDSLYYGYDLSEAIKTGSVDTSALGQYDVSYQINDLQIDIRVVVADVDGPDISVPSNVVFDVSLDSTFVPPICLVVDNYDSSPDCQVVSNTVDTSQMGTYYVTYQAEDSSGNTSLRTYTFEVVLPQADYDTSVTAFQGDIVDALYDEVNHAIFYIESNYKRLVKYDIETQAESYIYFDYAPETIHMRDGLVYVTLPHQEHSMYWFEEDQTGGLAIIDALTFVQLDLLELNADPYDLVVTDEWIVITIGSGQHGNMLLISTNNYSNRSQGPSVYQQLIIEGGYGEDGWLFGITTALSPQSLKAMNIDGVDYSFYDDPGHGDYNYGNKIFVSPYGDYVFSQYGQAFYQKVTIDHGTMEHAFDLGYSISAILHDLDTGTIMIGKDNGTIYLVDEDYIALEETNIGYRPDHMYGDSDTFYVISFTNSGFSFIEAIRED